MRSGRGLAAVVAAGVGLAGCGASDEAVDDAMSGEGGAAPAEVETAHNTLSDQEVADGWILLFDGETTDGFRGYGRDDMPESWVVVDGELTLQTEGGNMDGGDIVTVGEFTDFELTFDFRVGPQGNSGVFYRVQEAEGAGLWQVAAEYQVLDDPAYIEMGTMDMTNHLTGDNYALHTAEVRPLNPTGEWNSGRIVVEGNRVEHWLNGERTVQYELYSEDWEARMRASKFSVEPHYARAPSGSIGFQDHGTPVWYRNLKVRRLGE